MHGRIILGILLLAGVLAACTPPETYPLSGEDCGPNDPVQTLDVTDCTPPAT